MWLAGYSSLALVYLSCVTVYLNQLDPEEYNHYWKTSEAVILRRTLDIVPNTFDPLGVTTRKLNIEFIRILSKFLKDPDRARTLWVNSQKYADLVRYLLELLRNK